MIAEINLTVMAGMLRRCSVKVRQHRSLVTVSTFPISLSEPMGFTFWWRRGVRARRGGK